MKKFIRIALSLITIVVAAACNKTPNPDKNEDYKRTILFVMEEPVLEGDDIVFTSMLTDAESTPLADKNIRIVIKNVRTVSGVTDRTGQAIIRTEPISTGNYTCRGFFDGDDEYYSSYCDFQLHVLPKNQ